MKRKPTDRAMVPEQVPAPLDAKGNHPSRRVADGLVRSYTAFAMVPVAGKHGWVQVLRHAIEGGRVLAREPVELGEPEPVHVAVQRLATAVEMQGAEMQGRQWPQGDTNA